MSALSVSPPFNTFLDLNGESLEGGYIYIGTAGLNPVVSPIQVYWDAALTQPAAQPIRTIGGAPSRSGTPSSIYVNAGDYSILVRNSNHAFIYSALQAAQRISASLISYTPSGTGAVATTVEDILDAQFMVDYVALRAYTGLAKTVRITGLLTTAQPQGIAGTFQYDETDVTSADNGGTIIVGSDGRRWKRVALGPVQAQWFGADPSGLTDSTTAIQAAVNWAKVIANNNSASIVLGAGDFILSDTIVFDTIGIGFIGTEQEGRRQQGSDLSPSAVIWRGGASPMFRTSVSLMTFKNFAVRNEGTATDWLEMLSGSQHFIFDNLSIVGGSGGGGAHTPFTRSTIYSNGARLGYSNFRRCLVKTPSDAFILMEGSGAIGVTPFSFTDRCIFDSVGTRMTIIKVVNCALDAVILRDCTFNQQGPELTIFDNSTGTAQPCLSFAVENCEIDSQASTNTFRFFKWRDTANIRIVGGVANGGGVQLHLADLINSNIVQCEGLEYKSFAGNLFNPDSTSFINVGRNFRNSSAPVEFSLASAGVFKQTYVATMQLDLSKYPAYRHGVYEIDVTDAAAYTIRVDTSAPQGVTPGQIFTVVIRNVTAGAISAGAFTTNINTTGALTAPAAGNNRSYTFYWNGTRAIEISRVVADVLNA